MSIMFFEVDHTVAVPIQTGTKEWIEDNCNGRWRELGLGGGSDTMVVNTYVFEDEADAVAFKLMWT